MGVGLGDPGGVDGPEESESDSFTVREDSEDAVLEEACVEDRV